MKLKKSHSQKRKNQNITRKKRILKRKTIRNKKNQKRRRPTKKRIRNKNRNSNKIIKGGEKKNLIVYDITEKDDNGNVIWLNIDEKTKTVKDLLTLKDEKLTIPPNSCYMMSNKETTWPYAEEFLTIVRDQNGEYHLFNFNVFVDCEEVEKKKRNCKEEKLNYVYQDTFPCMTLQQLADILNKKEINANLTNLNDYQEAVNTLANRSSEDPLLPELELSWNQAWQLVRYFELEKYENSCERGLPQVEVQIERLLKKTSIPPPDNPNWDKFNDAKQLNKLKELQDACDEYRSKIIYNGLVKNLTVSGVDRLVDLNTMKFIVGRIDGRYAGRISLNFCHPKKYEKFSKDMERFEDGSEYKKLGGEDIPHLFDVSEEFEVVEKVFEDAAKSVNKEEFFNPEAKDFEEFIFKNLKEKKTNVIIIGENSNGEKYSELINREAELDVITTDQLEKSRNK